MSGSPARVGCALFVAALILCASPGSAGAATSVTLYASPSGAGDCSSQAASCTLADALASAGGQTGDAVAIVLAADGYGSITIPAPGGETSLTLDGAGFTAVASGGAVAQAVVDTSSLPTTLENLSVIGSGVSVSGGNLTLEQSLVADSSGAGIDVSAGGSLKLLDSTVADNDADGLETSATTDVYGSTIADNTGRGIEIAAGTTRVGASVLADNHAGDCKASTIGNDEGYNFTDDSSCGVAVATSQFDDAVSLGPLANNGGPTQTVALASASAGYDVVPSTATLPFDPAAGAFCAGEDERGLARTEGPASVCSAGAYQFAPPVISAVSPRPALELGLPVTIGGYGLAALTSVSFGATLGAVTSETNTQVTLDVPVTLALGSQPITLTDADGSASAPFAAVADPSLATLILAPGELRVPYSQSIPIAGGAGPFSFAQTAGSLPAGLSLSAGGLISGTPTKAGGTAFAVTVTDANGVSSQNIDLSLDIATPILTLAARPLDFTAGLAAVKLGCAGAPCVGSIRLTETIHKKVAGRRQALSVVLASGPYTLSAGQSSAVEIKLTADGAHLFARHAKRARAESLSASVTAGTAVTQTVRVS